MNRGTTTLRILTALLASTIVAAPTSALAKPKETITIARTGNWEINYDNDSCHLIAQFGEESPISALKLTRFQPGDRFDLTFYGKAFSYNAPTMATTISFGQYPSPLAQTAIVGELNHKLPMIMLLGLSFDSEDPKVGDSGPTAVTEEMEKAVTGIDLSARGKIYHLETGSLRAPMAAMRACLSDLIRHWGYDPAVQANLSRYPTAVDDPIAWLHADEIPERLFRNSRTGLMRFRIDVGENGTPLGCHILHSTKPDELADIACANFTKYAKFQPALDATGNPVKSYFIGMLQWEPIY